MREPFSHLIRSLWDCLTDKYSETIQERLSDAWDVLRVWIENKEQIAWDEIALAIYIEALFTECTMHDWLCFVRKPNQTIEDFRIHEYFDARASFALRHS